MSAEALTYDQRKALRRIGRGKSISRRMMSDALISRCFEWSVQTVPPKPVAEMNVVEYCDWEAEMRSGHPVLTDLGEQILAQLEGADR